MAVPQERVRVTEQVTAAVIPATFEGRRVSWGGVWSGFLVGIGVLLLLGALGIAVGVTTADLSPGGGAGARELGIGAGIWAFLSVLVALFLGGMVAARMGMVFDRATAVIQGVLVWVLTMLGVLVLAVSGVSMGLGVLFAAATPLARGAGAAAGDLAALASGNVDEILARLDDPTTAATVAAATGMSPEDARSALADIRRRVETARDDPARAAAEARQGLQQLAARAAERSGAAARQAQPYVSAGSWITFGVMVLSLICAALGAAWGGRRAALRAVTAVE